MDQEIQAVFHIACLSSIKNNMPFDHVFRKQDLAFSIS
jgi:hypothetical protein